MVLAPERSMATMSAATSPVNLEAPEASRLNLSPVTGKSEMKVAAPEREIDRTSGLKGNVTTTLSEFYPSSSSFNPLASPIFRVFPFS